MPTDPRYRIYPPEKVAEIRATLEPLAGRPLTDKECQESINNLVGFFQVLHDWAKEDKRQKAMEQASSQAAGAKFGGDGSPQASS